MKHLNFKFLFTGILLLLMASQVTWAQYSQHPVNDAVVWEKSPDQVAPDVHASNIFIGQSTGGDSTVIAYVQFDVTGLAGKVVTKAEFSTRSDVEDGKTMTVKLTEANDGFGRDTTNWNKKPGSKSGELASTVMDEDSGRKIYTENGTGLVDYINGKLMNGATKISFAIKYKEGDGTALKWCGGAGDGAWGPLLEMEFAPEAGYYAVADAVASQYQPDATANDLHGSNIFVGQNAGGDSATVAYVQFNLAGMAYRQIGEATFSTRSDVQDGKTMTVKLTSSDDNIDRATTTWNTKPSSSGDELAAVVMDENSDRKIYVENGSALVDYINSQLAMGDETITFAMKYKEGDGTAFKWCGGQGDGSWGPELKIGNITSVAAAYSSFSIGDAVVWQKSPDQVAPDVHASNIFIGQNTGGDSTVIAYVKFMVKGLANRTVTKASFSTRSDVEDGKTMTVKLTEAGNGFSRDTTNWNNKPSSKSGELASTVMDEDSGRKYYTENGTALADYITGKLMAGDTIVSFALKYSDGDGTALKWCGGQGDASWGPQLELEFSTESGYYPSADAVASQNQPDATANDLHASNIFVGQNAAKDSATVAYVQFNLMGMAYTAIEGVEFSTRSDVQDGKTMTVKLTGSDDNIDRATTTWNTKPTSSSTELAAVVMDQESNRKIYTESGTSFVDYINAQLAAGDETITLVMKYKEGDGTALKWCGGKGDGSYGPMLTVKSPSLVPDKDTIAILEDVYVDEADADANKNSSSDMGIRKADDGTGREVYLKFDISEAANAIVGNAALRLYIAQHSSGTQQDNFYADIFLVEDQTWSETTLTWNNKPVAGKKLLTENVTWFNSGKDTVFTSADLTHYINEAVVAGQQTITFAIKGKDVTNGNRLWMAESNWKPQATQLILDYTVAPPEKVASIVADSYVDQGGPDANFGGEADQQLINDDANNLSKWVYQKFDISTAYEDVISATVKVYASIHNSATDISTFDFEVYGVDDISWLENEITWNNKPSSGSMLFEGTAFSTGQYFNLSSSAFADYVNEAINSGKDSISLVYKGKNETPGNRAWISGRNYKAPELILNYEKQAVQPMFSPASGEFIIDVDVEITTLTSGATIYYTTDGTDPDDSSTEYTGAVKLTEDAVLKAIAYAPGLKESAITSGNYIVKPVGLPSFEPSAVPKYQPPLIVTIVAEPEDAVIRYSDDGGDPTTIYTEQIVLNETTTLKAQAFNADFSYSSEVVEVTYTIIPPTGTAGAGPGGVGYKDLSRSGQPELGLWLRPESLASMENGANILEWSDASGNENKAYNTWEDGGDNAITNTGESEKAPPVVTADALNGHPVAVMGAAEGELASLIIDDADNLDGGEGQAIFMVMKRNHMYGDFAALFQKRDIRSGAAQEAYSFEMNGGGDPNTIQHVINKDLFLRTDRIYNADDYYLLNVGLDGNHAMAYFYTNGTLEKTAAYVVPIHATNATAIVGGFQPINLAELAYFNSTLNAAQTVVVNEYLAAKFGMTLETGNLYTSTDYTVDLVGVGKATDLTGEGEEEHLHATGGALELMADGFTAAGDFVFAAHDGTAITEDDNKVWSRIWNVETAGDGGDVEMIFDFDKAGLTLANAGEYILAYRATADDQWADLGITPTADGNKLVFDVNGISDGQYAVGKSIPGGVGVDANVFSKSFDLYPNPASDMLNISLSNDQNGMVQISIVDFTGRNVMTTAVMKGTVTLETQLNISDLEKGMYLIELKQGDARSTKSLIIE